MTGDVLTSMCLSFSLSFPFWSVHCRSGVDTREGDRLGWGVAWPSEACWADSVGSSLLAVSSLEVANRESKSFSASSESQRSSFAFPSVSLWFPCSFSVSNDLLQEDLLDRWDIRGFLLVETSVKSSTRECLKRWAGEELGVSRRGLTWALGTVRRFCCGWKSLLSKTEEQTFIL